MGEKSQKNQLKSPTWRVGLYLGAGRDRGGLHSFEDSNSSSSPSAPEAREVKIQQRGRNQESMNVLENQPSLMSYSYSCIRLCTAGVHEILLSKILSTSGGLNRTAASAEGGMMAHLLNNYTGLPFAISMSVQPLKAM